MIDSTPHNTSRPLIIVPPPSYLLFCLLHLSSVFTQPRSSYTRIFQWLLNMSATSLPANVHISQHPCAQAKLSQLRSTKAGVRETRALLHEISTIIAVEATAAGLTVKNGHIVRMRRVTCILCPSLTQKLRENHHWLRIYHSYGSPRVNISRPNPPIRSWHARWFVSPSAPNLG